MPLFSEANSPLQHQATPRPGKLVLYCRDHSRDTMRREQGLEIGSDEAEITNRSWKLKNPADRWEQLRQLFSSDFSLSI